MKAKTISEGILRAVAIIVAVVLLVYFLIKIQSVIAYLAIAAVIALLGRPIVLFLRRKLKFPNTSGCSNHNVADGGALFGNTCSFYSSYF